ncbi:MAG: hypothetical protein AB7O81_30510 [Blastocatellales bacterium]
MPSLGRLVNARWDDQRRRYWRLRQVAGRIYQSLWNADETAEKST